MNTKFTTLTYHTNSKPIVKIIKKQVRSQKISQPTKNNSKTTPTSPKFATPQESLPHFTP